MKPLRVLILGGYGTFGGRLAALLRNEEDLVLIVAGRSLEKAQKFCNRLNRSSVAAEIDRNTTLQSQIATLRPDLLIDASGPFQVYGKDPYRVVKACLEANVHYFDFADGADFVRGIAQFDEEAKKRKLMVVSGVSTFPALSFAVARDLARDMKRVERYSAGVAPSPYATMGLSVIQAIASYAGKSVKRWRDGKETKGAALIDAQRFTIAPPGALPLKSRRFALVDVPDLTLAREIFPDLRSSWVGAGTEPHIWHSGLSVLAWLVRLHLLPSLRWLARLFHGVQSRWRWGEDRGGMFVSLRGWDHEGRKTKRIWNLIADGDTGPFVPCLPAQALVNRFLAEQIPEPGARTAAAEFELAELQPLFRRHPIRTGILTSREDDPSPLYRKILGDAYETLPPALQEMHDGIGLWRSVGKAEIVRGRSPVAWLAARIIGFPPAGNDVPLRVTFDGKSGAEKWTRNFAGKTFFSVQTQGKGRAAHLDCERFGPMEFAMALVVEDNKLRLVIRRWTFFGFPMPMFLAPRGETYESEEDGKFHFHVEITLPVFGRIVRYRGWLVRER